MDSDVLFFFNEHMDALPLYEAFADRVTQEIEGVQTKVHKSQISFYNKHLFACVSFARIRRKKYCPLFYIVVTIGLNRRLESPRIDVATEPYPNRWTHHLLISNTKEIDDELLSWIKEAATFSNTK